MNWKRFLGIILVIAGIVLILNSSGITGFAILQDIGRTAGSILGLVLVAGGVLLLQAREGEEGGLERVTKATKIHREIGEELKSGRAGTARELLSYAKRLGLRVIEGGSHQYRVETPEGKYLETISYHPGGMGKGLYRKILKSFDEYAISVA